MTWLSWIIQVEKLKLKNVKGFLLFSKYNWNKLSKYCSDYVFLSEYIIKSAKGKNSQTATQVQALYSFYRYNFNPKSRKLYLLSYCYSIY